MNFTLTDLSRVAAHLTPEQQVKLSSGLVSQQRAHDAQVERIKQTIRKFEPQLKQGLQQQKPALYRSRASQHLKFTETYLPGENRQQFIARQLRNDGELLKCNCAGCKQQYRERSALYR